MRSAPPLQVAVDRHGVWRAMVALLAAGACATMAAWWWMQPVPAPLVSAVASLAVLTTVAFAISLWRVPTQTLRWDGRRWHVASDLPGRPTAERAGELAVAIDLGGWMLLRFVPESAGTVTWWPRRPVWMAMQRGGLEAPWHALRCAVYAARPALPPAGATPFEAPLA